MTSLQKVATLKVWGGSKLIEMAVVRDQYALQSDKIEHNSTEGRLENFDLVRDREVQIKMKKLRDKLRKIEGKARRGNKEKAPQTREEAIEEAANELEKLAEQLDKEA